MNCLCKLVLAGAACILSLPSHATWYSDEGAFVAAIDPVFYLEDFPNFQNGVTLNGSQTNWQAPGANGYGWEAFAELGLWSLDGALSTASPGDPLELTFAGSPVTAFGAILYGTDFFGMVLPDALVTLTLSNGESMQIVANGTDFVGWTGVAPIVSLSIEVEQPFGQLAFSTVDHAYTGSAVPEPRSILVLGMGLLGTWLFKRSGIRRS